VIQNKFIEVARSYVGTPFLHQGRLPGVGLDCIGVIVCAAHEIGINLIDSTDYDREPNSDKLQSEIQKQLVRVIMLIPGDILLIAYMRDPRHTAIYTGSTIIHAHNRVDKVVEHNIDDRLMSHVKSIWRFKEFI